MFVYLFTACSRNRGEQENLDRTPKQVKWSWDKKLVSGNTWLACSGSQVTANKPLSHSEALPTTNKARTFVVGLVLISRKDYMKKSKMEAGDLVQFWFTFLFKSIFYILAMSGAIRIYLGQRVRVMPIRDRWSDS